MSEFHEVLCDTLRRRGIEACLRDSPIAIESNGRTIYVQFDRALQWHLVGASFFADKQCDTAWGASAILVERGTHGAAGAWRGLDGDSLVIKALRDGVWYARPDLRSCDPQFYVLPFVQVPLAYAEWTQASTSSLV